MKNNTPVIFITNISYKMFSKYRKKMKKMRNKKKMKGSKKNSRMKKKNKTVFFLS